MQVKNHSAAHTVTKNLHFLVIWKTWKNSYSEEQFTCLQCSKKFAIFGDLKEHKSTHAGEESYSTAVHIVTSSLYCLQFESTVRGKELQLCEFLTTHTAGDFCTDWTGPNLFWPDLIGRDATRQVSGRLKRKSMLRIRLYLSGFSH